MKVFFRTILVFDLIVINLVVGYLIFQVLRVKNTTDIVGNVTNNTEYVDRCGTECQKAIALEVAKIPTSTPMVFPTLMPTKQAVVNSQTTTKKVRKEEIFTLIGNGSTSNNEWSDIDGTNFYFDTRDYPGLVEVYFEANMKLVNGNGLAYLRLYDVTNNIAVNGSENTTTSQSSVWTKSQRVYFWAGKNLIRVQGKSLTADTVVFEQGRLRIVTEN